MRPFLRYWHLTATDNALGHTTDFTYDAVGNLTAIEDARNWVTQFVYDEVDRRILTVDALTNQTAEQHDPVGNVIAITDANGHTTQFGYDKINRPTTVTDPLGNVTTTAFDEVDNVTSILDGNGNGTQYEYDYLSRQTGIIDGNGDRTTNSYDAVSNLISVEDASLNITTFDYDKLGRMVLQTDPLGNATQYFYDAVVRTGEIDRLGRQRDFVYDDAYRLIQQVWRDAGGAVVETLDFSYDSVGNVLTANNNHGSYTLSYDAEDQVLTSTDPWGLTLNFAYDEVGNRIQVTDSLGGTTDSVYDAVNNLIRRDFSDTGGASLRFDRVHTPVYEISFIARHGDLVALPLVATSSYSYDDADRLIDLHHEDGLLGTIGQYTFSYDNGGRLTSRTINGVLENFTYDNADQLTNETTDEGAGGSPPPPGGGGGSGSSTDYGYDATGNRINSNQVIGVGNQLLSDDTWNYTYDAEGNLTKKVHVVTGETWTYGYDHRNQMVWAKKFDSDGGLLLLSAEFQYDVFGNRIEKTLDLDADGVVDDTERYAYDGFKPGGGVGNENWDIWADLDETNALVTRYIRGDHLDELVARIDALGDINWYYPDHQGSLRHITDNLGLVIADIAYNAFGIITSESNPNETGRHTYTGREWDPSLGLYYYRARYYDAETGRWTTQDPLGFAAGDANFYRYVGNNATNATDPSGNEPITVIVVGGTMLALAGIGGLLYTAARYDYASEHYMGMSAAEWTPEIQDEFSNYVMTSRYIAAGSYVAAQTGISMVGAPLFGYGMGYAWGAWGLAGKLGVLSFTGIGIGGLVYEGYNIVRDWNQMDGPQRFERVGLLAGPTLVGLRYGPRFFRSGLRDGWARPVSTRGWTPQTHTGRAGPLSHTGRPGPLPHTGRPGPLPHTGRPGPGVAPNNFAQQAAIRQRVLANIAESQAARNASNFNVHAAYERLAQLRRGLGLPNTGVRQTDGVLTLLEVNGRRYYGINSWAASDDAARTAFTNAGFRNPATGNVPHRAVANHAEGDVFLQSFLAGNTGGRGRLFIDSTMCGFCGRSGGVRGMARALGLESLEVFERLPNGQIRRIPNLLE